MSRPGSLWGDTTGEKVVDGRYRLLGPLGAGGIGKVFRAERIKIGRTVAIKFLKSDFADDDDHVRRFEREALAMSRIYHPHCVGLIDFGVHEGAPYLVMEYLSGRTLTEEIRRGKLVPRRAVGIMHQLLEALAYLHGRNVIHRDLKSDNVMLVEAQGATDFVKLLDLGMAKLMAGIGADINVSAAGILVGTPSAMSPEQILGKALDERTDIYSAGVLLYHMIVGRKPFLGADISETIKLQLEAAPPSPREILGRRAVSGELEGVINRALAKDRDERYQSAAELAAALAATPEGARAARDPGTSLQRIPAVAAAPEPRRRLWVAAILGWLVAAGLAAVVVAEYIGR